MFYKYDEKSLRFIKVKRLSRFITTLVILLGVSILIILEFNFREQKIAESRVMIIMAQHNQFSPEKLVERIKTLHFPYPHIVYAQALLETNNFHSYIFKENNNLFGMHEATQRLSTAKGSQNNYAYYTSWIDSVYDYALYYSTYLSKLQNEEDYFNYLSQSYAEDTSYVTKIKSIINIQQLKSRFK